MVIIGHRGACGYAPENTRASFEKAIALGVDMIELDVHQCASGEPVVIHDKTVDRTTNGTGLVKTKTLAELQKLDAGDGQSIPTLAQVFDLIDRRVVINIEIKDPDAVIPVGQLISTYVQDRGWDYQDFLVSSFNHETVRASLEQFPHIPRAPIFDKFFFNDLSIIKRLDASCVVMNHATMSEKLLSTLHAQNLRVFVYTVNDVREAKRLKELGIDGIISDYPDILLPLNA